MKIDKETIVKKALAALSEEEKQQVLQWAREAHGIQTNKSLTLTKKFNELQKLKISPIVASVLTRLYREIKTKGWDERSWPVRLGFGGLALGAATFGSQSIGIAGFGTGIGVSLAVVSGLGGSVLGLIVSHLENEGRKKTEAKKSKQ
jgi:hypothetical protein